MPKSPPAKAAESKAAEPVTEPLAKPAEASKADEKMPGEYMQFLADYTMYMINHTLYVQKVCSNSLCYSGKTLH